ncbi:MAG: hypothetical protein AB7F22_25455 [Reyranella sp.]|uniref:hypothetical protein n=1 Tax=Reyranella sp. TaxID=1929291 RepID=UPI003D15288C
MARTFTVTPEALRQAERLGLGGADAEAIIRDMARRASRITHPAANRRYRNFILFVTPDDVVTMISAMDESEARWLGQRTYDERKAAEDDGSPGEAIVERIRRR